MGQDRNGISVEVLPPAGLVTPAARRGRRDGWTPHRMHAFIEVLAQLGSVKDACRAVGLSTTSAYKLYHRDPGFAAAWDRALATIRPSLEEAAYQRGVVGWEEPVFHGGQVVGYRRRFSDGLLRLLIERGFDPRRKAEVAVTDEQDVLSALDRKLGAIKRRVAGDKRREQMEWCERMEREGKAP